MDDTYRLLRKNLHSCQRLFYDIRTLTRYLCFQRWDALMDFRLESFTGSPA